ncbi:MAG TPA: HD domain-containing protein [Phycisphaerae bacterium]|nr:HD domain-containing protein [Phycisphaerae bacterium]HRW55051.1 HD domain-containing protein [Phycisphaerae bacterium]
MPNDNPTARRWRKVFRDPIHDLIELREDDRFVLDLINAKEFQRLRRIKQLGLANLVFPGAEHSRFVHSLGVFNYARRILEVLKYKYPRNTEFGNALRTHEYEIKAAALLHDVGHGPFSHVFERVFEDASPKHEEWSCRIILSEESEINQVLCAQGEVIDIRTVAALVYSDAAKLDDSIEAPENYIKDIVSSQLDADRMDYLARDSLFTGSKLGTYDSEWIINSLMIARPDEGSPPKICLDQSKGAGAAVALLSARRLMTLNVYSHRATRAYEAELVATLRLARHCVGHLPTDTPESMRNVLQAPTEISVKDYLLTNDDIAWASLGAWARMKTFPAGESGNLLRRLQHHAVRLVRRKRPWRHKRSTGTPDLMRWKRTIVRLEENGDPRRFECFLDEGNFLPYKSLAYETAKGKDIEEAFLSEIHFVEKDGSTKILSELQDENREIVRAFQAGTNVSRVFYDEEHADLFETQSGSD